MTRRQAILDYIGYYLDGEISPRYEVRDASFSAVSGGRFT